MIKNLGRFKRVLQVLVLLGSLVIIVSFSIEIFHFSDTKFLATFIHLQFGICLLFLLDLFVGLLSAENKIKYICTHFVFFLVSIPYLSIVESLNLDLPNDVYYCLRLMPVFRGGYALVMVVSWFSKSKMSNLFISYLLSLVTVIYFSSLIFYAVEKPVNSGVDNYFSAIWWAFMDATTVGSNINATTSIGKILSVLLAAFGMMMFPIFTVYIMERMQKFVNNGNKK